MKNKKLIIVFIILLVLIVVSLLGLKIYSNKHKSNYRSKGYEETQILQTFNEEKDEFDEVCNIIFKTPKFWINARRDNESVHAWIMSPNETKKLELFNKTDRKIIISFFEKYKPYMVSLDGNKYITITFDDINNGVGFCFVKFADPNCDNREEYIEYLSQWYTVTKIDDWNFMYIKG